MSNWLKIASMADRFAIPFWIMLIVYGVYEINRGNNLSYVPLIIGIGALIIDSIFVIENRRIK